MSIKGKRIINLRPMCLFAFALIVGLLLAEGLYGEHVAYITLPILLFLVAFVTLLCLRKVRRFAYVPIAFILGFALLSVSNWVYDLNTLPYFEGEFSATISSDIIVEDGKASMYIDNITIGDVAIKYEASLTVSMDEDTIIDFNAGDRVAFYGSLDLYEHNKFDTFFATCRANGVAYSSRAEIIGKVSEEKAKFPLNIQNAIKKVLYENTDEYTSSVCQALILGDKSTLDRNAYANIKASGLAHVLAVSGLHITALASAVYFLLKKLKVNPKISFVIVLALTFLYSMICSFTASSLRAFIMSGVFSFASSFGQKRDNLSALAFSAILILFARPTAIMEIGFLLSFYAVLGIFLFCDSFEKVGMRAVNKISPKRHIGTKFVKVCAVSLATNIATYPLVACFFKEVPTLFLLSNFVMLPYVMFVYILTLVLTLLSLITTFGGFVWILKFLLIPFRVYVGGIGSLSFATIPVYMSVGGVVTFSIVMLTLSKFVFLTRRQRAQGALICTSVGMALSTLLLIV